MHSSGPRRHARGKDRSANSGNYGETGTTESVNADKRGHCTDERCFAPGAAIVAVRNEPGRFSLDDRSRCHQKHPERRSPKIPVVEIGIVSPIGAAALVPRVSAFVRVHAFPGIPDDSTLFAPARARMPAPAIPRTRTFDEIGCRRAPELA